MLFIGVFAFIVYSIEQLQHFVHEKFNFLCHQVPVKMLTTAHSIHGRRGLGTSPKVLVGDRAVTATSTSTPNMT